VLVVIAMTALLVLALRSADLQVGVEWGLVDDMQEQLGDGWMQRGYWDITTYWSNKAGSMGSLGM
jgi:hypothetical protein